MGIEELDSDEMRVWQRILEGKSIREIAGELHLSWTHAIVILANLCRKLGISYEPEAERDQKLCEAAQEWMTK